MTQTVTLENSGSPATRSLFWETLRLLRYNLLAMLGAVIILLLVIVAFAGSALSPYDPNEMDFTARLAPPSLEHPFGTDDFGRDVLSRVLDGRLRLAAGRGHRRQHLHGHRHPARRRLRLLRRLA
jgi:ABC-type dipeptide/oligopeptide/nickel transport system permease subunit